ncbi:amidohydrolase family protein [Streptomyces scabiei]|uniref:amidohydrolase family protein n=1 Tax=Streptomyces scabiei TaxID=1930 RepID=UPI0038F72FE3
MHAGILFTGGTVRTGAADTPVHDALAVTGGRISALGAQARAARGPRTTVVDLAGGALLPAFGDGHVHPVMGGLSLAGVPVRDTTSVDEIVDVVRAWAAAHPHAEWITGDGFDPWLALDGRFDARWLDAAGSGQAVAAAKNPAEMFFTAMTQYVGGWATDVQRVLIVTSVLAALLAFHNAITRYVYALSAENVAPAALGRVHPRHGSPWVAGIAQSVLAVVVVAVFAVIGVDPYTKFFLWVNTPGVVGILVLQSLAAFAVVAFFRRNSAEHGEGPLRTLLAPAAAGLLLTAVTVLVCKRLDLFTGAGATVNWALVALTPAVFLSGMALAARIRRARPDIYAKLAITDVDAT